MTLLYTMTKQLLNVYDVSVFDWGETILLPKDLLRRSLQGVRGVEGDKYSVVGWDMVFLPSNYIKPAEE